MLKNRYDEHVAGRQFVPLPFSHAAFCERVGENKIGHFNSNCIEMMPTSRSSLNHSQLRSKAPTRVKVLGEKATLSTLEPSVLFWHVYGCMTALCGPGRHELLLECLVVPDFGSSIGLSRVGLAL